MLNSTWSKLLLGLATIFPLLYFIYFLTIIFSKISNPNSMMELQNVLPTMFALQGLAILVTFILYFIYLIHIINNPKIKNEGKAIWVIAIFFGSYVGMFIYWVNYILNSRKK